MSNGKMEWTLSANAGGLMGALAAANKQLLGLGSSLLAMTGVGLGAGGVFALLAKGINFNARLEQDTISFKTLLGSLAAAKERMADLNKFAASTPFELPEVIQASKVLQALTGGALASGDGLRLVGDAASAAGRSFGETATWIGRLYGGLKSGTPVGEATMRLLEMGLISGDTKNRLNQLAESGTATGRAMEILRETFGKTSGAMKDQSTTFNGLLSTLKDNISQALGKALLPVFDQIKTAVDKLTQFDWEGLGKRVASVFSGLTSVFRNGQFTDLISLSIQAGVEQGVNAASRMLQAFFAALPKLLDSAFTAGKGLGGRISSAMDSLQVVALDKSIEENKKRGEPTFYLEKLRDEAAARAIEADEAAKATMLKAAEEFREAVKAGMKLETISIMGDSARNALAALLARKPAGASVDAIDPEKPSAKAQEGGTVTRQAKEANVTNWEKIGFVFGNGRGNDHNRAIADNTKRSAAALELIWQRVKGRQPEYRPGPGYVIEFA